MTRRVLATALVTMLVTACSGEDRITGPTSPLQPTVMNAIGTDPASGATIETNKDDYVPGEVVHLEGRGWAPDEIVHLFMTEAPDTHGDVSMDVQADATGAFSLHFYDVELHDLGVTFTLTATGRTSGSVAVAVFTDAVPVTGVTLNGMSAVTVEASSSIAAVVSGNVNTGGGNNTLGAIAIDAYLSGGNPATAARLRCFDVSPNIVRSTPGNTAFAQSFSFDAPAGAGVYDVIVSTYGDNTCTTAVASVTLDDAITVESENAAPELTAIGDKSVDELSELAFTATATDETVATLQFSLANPASGTFPTGATITAGGAFSWTPTELQGPGVYRVKVVVSDDGGLTDEEEIEIEVFEVNLAPELNAIGDRTVDELMQLAFTATATDGDLPANTLTFSLANPASGTFPTGAGITIGGSFTWTPTEAQGPGVYRVKVVVSDGTDADEEELQITVNEVNVAPVLGSIGSKTVDEGALLSFTATATDADIPANQLTFSLGAGAPAGAAIDPTSGAFTWTPPDGPASVSITVNVADDGAPGLNDSETITVTVNNKPPIISAVALSPVVAGNIYPISQPVTVTATFSDPGALDTHSCSTTALATGVAPLNAGPTPLAMGTTCANVLTFLEPGVYDVTITVTDKDGGSDNAIVQVVVYDPSAGFVTGGGWIDSPAGAYYADRYLSGKATFGFVAKYQKGATVPVGNTQFVFHAGGFNFHSSQYDFLIVNQGGSNAQYKGTGTVNGSSGYTFMLWATDGSPDKLRIKIWETATNAPVYDNLLGGADGQVQAIANGSVVIHTPKK